MENKSIVAAGDYVLAYVMSTDNSEEPNVELCSFTTEKDIPALSFYRELVACIEANEHVTADKFRFIGLVTSGPKFDTEAMLRSIADTVKPE